MSDVWYYADRGERVGPVNVEALRAALAKFPDAASVLVWKAGFTDWQRAGDIAELRGGGAAPPPSAPFGPTGAVGAQSASAGPYVQPDILNLWFGFKGRVNRAKLWLVGVVNLAIMVFGAICAFLAGSTAVWVLFGLGYAVLFVSALAIGVKRLHDRDKSGWWVLVFYVLPSILSGIGAMLGHAGSAIAGLIGFGISIWGFVELGCLRGTQGPNRFGADPLGGEP
jgi:uncharacterized membrane protein YhaH (DUF805 family)